MTVSMWMTRDLVTIEPSTLITEASALMARRSIRQLPVVDRHLNRLVGMVTATDILRAFPSDVNPFAIGARETHRTLGTTAEEIMNPNPLTTTPEAPIEESARVMRDQKIAALPVVREDRLLGLITESDIFRAFVSLFESPRGGVRITFEIGKKEEDVFGMIAQLALRTGVRVVSLNTTEQENRGVCVVRLTGAAGSEIVDALWGSGHHVLNVLRFRE
jgi:acetoin utilization protein AcuB